MLTRNQVIKRFNDLDVSNTFSNFFYLSSRNIKNKYSKFGSVEYCQFIKSAVFDNNYKGGFIRDFKSCDYMKGFFIGDKFEMFVYEWSNNLFKEFFGYILFGDFNYVRRYIFKINNELICDFYKTNQNTLEINVFHEGEWINILKNEYRDYYIEFYNNQEKIHLQKYESELDTASFTIKNDMILNQSLTETYPKKSIPSKYTKINSKSNVKFSNTSKKNSVRKISPYTNKIHTLIIEFENGGRRNELIFELLGYFIKKNIILTKISNQFVYSHKKGSITISRNKSEAITYLTNKIINYRKIIKF
jgi:hypothetical protein